MKKIIPILFVIVALMFTSCASLYTSMYAPRPVKEAGGELVMTASAKGYEILSKTEDGEIDIVKQENTTSVLWQYKTKDGRRYFYVNRDYTEFTKTKFIENNFTLNLITMNKEDYEGKCENMTPNTYNYYCKHAETGENYKIKQFPWGTGYGYFYALVTPNNKTIVYSVPISGVKFY